MPESSQIDDDRHKVEEAARRAKRKASKGSKSQSQLEKDRQGKEYRKEILRKAGAGGASPGKSSGSGTSSSRHHKKQKTSSSARTGSAFQELFAQRAQGFQIEFRFRNAPPRPPVGPCFVGHSIDAVLNNESKQYKPHNAVEANHTWRLHNEPDIGVPLAPSAMDLKSYQRPKENATVSLHPDDDALLHWKGSMGDTAADNRKRRQEQVRTAARLAASGQSPAAARKVAPAAGMTAQQQQQSASKQKKKGFSRVLREDMQTWMKKTTYLSNDYSRKVHDFKSLAQTKSELATDLQSKQDSMAVRRSAKAIEASFTASKPLQHPTNKALKPKHVCQVLPDSTNWGLAFTHLVIDKAPMNLPPDYTVKDLTQAFVMNVEKLKAKAHMTCNVIVPAKNQAEPEKSQDLYQPVQSYDLDVVPLKEEDVPHMNFCLMVDTSKKIATYIPVASRVQLATGRPAKAKHAAQRKVQRRQITEQEVADFEKQLAEIDVDMAEKHGVRKEPSFMTSKPAAQAAAAATAADKKDEDGDDDDDFGDSSDEEVFGGGAKTIVAD